MIPTKQPHHLALLGTGRAQSVARASSVTVEKGSLAVRYLSWLGETNIKSDTRALGALSVPSSPLAPTRVSWLLLVAFQARAADRGWLHLRHKFGNLPNVRVNSATHVSRCVAPAFIAVRGASLEP